MSVSELSVLSVFLNRCNVAVVYALGVGFILAVVWAGVPVGYGWPLTPGTVVGLLVASVLGGVGFFCVRLAVLRRFGGKFLMREGVRGLQIGGLVGLVSVATCQLIWAALFAMGEDRLSLGLSVLAVWSCTLALAVHVLRQKYPMSLIPSGVLLFLRGGVAERKLSMGSVLRFDLLISVVAVWVLGMFFSACVHLIEGFEIAGPYSFWVVGMAVMAVGGFFLVWAVSVEGIRRGGVTALSVVEREES